MNNSAPNMISMPATNLSSEHVQVKGFGIWYTVILNYIIAILAVAGNGLTLAAILKNNKLQTPTNVFIASLAVADLLVGISIPTMTFVGALYYSGMTSLSEVYFCLLNHFFYMFPMICSAYHVFIIAFERYVAIVCPLRYHHIRRRSMLISDMVTIWLSSAITAAFPLFLQHAEESREHCDLQIYANYYIVYMVAMPLFGKMLVATCMYTHIFVIAWKQNKKIHGTYGNNKKEVSVRDLKAVKTLSITVGAFILSWLPYLIYCILQVNGVIPFSTSIYSVFLSLALANSCMNFIIYAVRNSEFSQTFSGLCCCSWWKARLGFCGIE